MKNFILKHGFVFAVVIAVVSVLAAASPFFIVVWLAESR